MLDSPPYRTSTDGLIADDDDDHLPGRHTYKKFQSSSTRLWQHYLMLSMSLLILILCSIIVFQQASMPTCRTSLYTDSQRSQRRPSPDISAFDVRNKELIMTVNPAIDETHDSRVHFVSKYSSKDTEGMAAVDAAWDAITPTLGTVALDVQFAESLGLPAAESLRADPSKGVYVLEAYHSVHCLQIIRQTLFRLARGQELIVPFGHATHCLAGILEHVVCSADDTLLYHKEGLSVGDGQARTCRNWGALREWAGNHSACYYVDEIATQHEDLTGLRCPTEDGLSIEEI